MTAALEEPRNARSIASRLTKRIMREVTGSLGKSTGFGKTLKYTDLGHV